MADLVPVRRALISASDKTGVGEFAMALHKEFQIDLISTVGTAKERRVSGRHFSCFVARAILLLTSLRR
jgi:AICAR transformylase/IMP cyclohydrolase PurH